MVIVVEISVDKEAIEQKIRLLTPEGKERIEKLMKETTGKLCEQVKHHVPRSSRYGFVERPDYRLKERDTLPQRIALPFLKALNWLLRKINKRLLR